MDLEARAVYDDGMDSEAVRHVVNYIEEHLDKSDDKPFYKVFIV